VTLHNPRPLQAGDDLVGFDCGVAELDSWLKERARMAAAASTARTFVAVDDDGRVCAYYALCPASVRRVELPARHAQGTPDPVGVILLARLAVDRRHQRQGLGRALVSDAARRTVQAAEAIAGRALIVHAAGPAAAKFYAELGFDEFPTDPLHLGILLKDLRRRYIS
jgi:GNAT superfamily N-acetyltransferase